MAEFRAFLETEEAVFPASRLDLCFKSTERQTAASGEYASWHINAQNKQTVQTIIRPLRDLGIPAAGIVDIDLLKEGGSVWTSFLESAFVPEIERNSLSTARAAVKQRFEQTSKDMKRVGGVELLATGDKEAAYNLLERLAEYGLFTVPHGELESWLKLLGATGHGPAWLISIFEKMGEDPASASYLKPTDDDVWQFGKIARRQRGTMATAAAPNQGWSMDFMSDKLADGRSFCILTVVDQFTRGRNLAEPT
jgi:hypothetical protein